MSSHSHDMTRIRSLIMVITELVGDLSKLTRPFLIMDDPRNYEPFELGQKMIDQGNGRERKEIIKTLTSILEQAVFVAVALEVNYNGCIINKWILNHDRYPMEESKGTGAVKYTSILKRKHTSMEEKQPRPCPQYEHWEHGDLYDFNCFRCSDRFENEKTGDEGEKDFISQLEDVIETFNYAMMTPCPWEIFKDTMFLPLTNLGEKFAKDRDWGDVYKPRNLLLALIAEVGELAENVQWKNDIRSPLSLQERMSIAEELADVSIYCLRIFRLYGKGESWNPFYEHLHESDESDSAE